jgi:K+-sensing histidine kinase KdpD
LEAEVSNPGSVETGLRVRRLERRNRWMWLLNIALICFLSVTVAILYRLQDKTHLASWLQAPGGEVTLIGGLCGLTILFCLYMFHKQIELTKVRQDLLGIRIREEAVRSRLTGISHLLDASSPLLESLEQNVSLDLVSLNVKTCMEADHASLYLLEAGSDDLVCRSVTGANANECRNKTESKGQGVVGTVVNTGEAMQLDGSQISSQENDPEHQAYESLIVVPIAVEEEILGVIQVARTEPCDLFVPSDARALTAFGTHVGRALKRLEQLGTVDQPQDEPQEIELKPVKASSDQGQLFELLEGEAERPLSRISRCAEILMQGSEPLSPERRTDLGRDLLEQMGDLKGLVENVAELMRLQVTNGSAEHEALDLNEIVREALLAVEPEATRRGIRIEPDLDPSMPDLTLEAGAISQAVDSLIMAGAALCDSGNTMWISTERESSSVELSVMCSGSEVGPELRERLFQPPDPGAAKLTEQIERLQLPLHLASRTATRHGGQLWAEEVSGNGLRLRLRLPAATGSPTQAEEVSRPWTPSAEPSPASDEPRIIDLDPEGRMAS